MTPPIYRIRIADAEDVGAVLGLRRHAERWLKDAGIEQWTATAYGTHVIKSWINAGSTFVIESPKGDVIGSLSLDRGDPDFWTAEELAEPATYLYKFILLSEYRGSGLGDLLLDWASYRAELAGSLWLRLDCWRDNTGLHAYYGRRGFTHLDTRSHPIRKSGALFERPVELRLVENPALRLKDETLNGELFPHALRGASI